MKRKIRPLIIGKDAAGKSWLAATFPKPMLVFLFDPPDKAGVYLDRGQPGDVKADKYCYYQEVFSTKGGESPIIRLEFWGEQNPQEGKSYMRFFGRTANLERELRENKYQTATFDSITHFELMARFCSEFNIHKDNEYGPSHYGYSGKAIEQYVLTRWPNLIMVNAVMIGHPGEAEKGDSDDGETQIAVRTVEAPGKAPSKVGTAYAEVWRVYIDQQSNQRRLQTTPRARNPYACKTSIGVPDGCYPHYDAIWDAIEAKKPEIKEEEK